MEDICVPCIFTKEISCGTKRSPDQAAHLAPTMGRETVNLGCLQSEVQSN